ncbi:MAG: hypothetical protein B7Y86_13170 [Brevundimonas subvibrioides]|uniref:Dihydroorotate dehydrogenase n=1 Tax=Brevundimonas subvibrioides TaxID=74313 RepID=A0A258HF37_9CAUL|nr:DUF952 domain-containing protein [Brevundimonas subvibrioides]OYX55601.1 MAG: hypothetical protein B7Y86_13170 [Brevundimonas subvibrioides]
MTETVAYKIIDAAEWREAVAEGVYAGSAFDLADGYIHLSTADQLDETARKHYAGRENLVLLTVDLTALDDTTVWEASRGGALFPHIYGLLPVKAVTETVAYSSPIGGGGPRNGGGGQPRTPNPDRAPSVTAQRSAAPPPPTGEE